MFFIKGDCNGHIGIKGDGHETTNISFSYKERNNKEVSILLFMVAYKILIANY